MSALPPSRQVDLWNAFHPETFLPSSGKRKLWVLRRGVLDDLAPSVGQVLPRAWHPTKNEQLVFRAVLEALATGRERQGEIVEFCNDIHTWPSVLGAADYLTGNLADAVRVATQDVADDRQPRRLHLPSWALVGTLLEALGPAPRQWNGSLVAFTAALATVLGPEKAKLTSEHARLLIRLYLETDVGRKESAPEAVLRAGMKLAPPNTPWGDGAGDKFRELMQALQSLQLLQIGQDQEIRWTALTLVHLPPGQVANGSGSSPFK
ncbi:hypothetical protein [Variovorax sp. GT1P44]|uniref:hypothetical protein n=1 Tax=Variovorax sp. GT1P44 TaxID=3443742 RepID=UPI003F474D56